MRLRTGHRRRYLRRVKDEAKLRTLTLHFADGREGMRRAILYSSGRIVLLKAIPKREIVAKVSFRLLG